MGMKREKYLEKQVDTLQKQLANKVRQINMIRAVASNDEGMMKNMLKLEGIYTDAKIEGVREFQKHHMAGLSSILVNDMDFEEFIEQMKGESDETS